jgi:protein-S-isoprenylcysteine O-methyltransferase Ste14
MFTLLGLSLIFPVAIPLLLVFGGPFFDGYFNLISFDSGIPNILTGLFLIITGCLFAFWSVYVQFTIGRGTPVPMMPTHKLIIRKPYSYCRNPMSLGAILLYLGIAIWVGSLSAVLLIVFFTLILLTYNKLIEERELQERYGAEYLEYKRKTPFLLPRISKRS